MNLSGLILLPSELNNLNTSNGGVPKRVNLCLTSSNPFSNKIALIYSRIKGAVRYSILVFERRSSTS